jgi:hypothetical protein
MWRRPAVIQAARRRGAIIVPDQPSSLGARAERSPRPMTDIPAMPGTIRLRTDRIDFVEVEGRQVILDSRRSVYYSVNETGLQLWSALRTDTTETELRRILIEAHGVSEETAAKDIAAFLNQLEQHGLLTRTPAPVID